VIRKYKKEDQEKLLYLLRLNTPKYFAAAEEEEFIDYLDQEAEHYFVVEKENKIVGTGGYNLGFDNGKTARISWDIIHPDFQGQGIGKELTQYRIDRIKEHSQVNKIVVRTSQLVFKFYEKNGFKLERIEKDFWAKDFDLYFMTMEIG